MVSAPQEAAQARIAPDLLPPHFNHDWGDTTSKLGGCAGAAHSDKFATFCPEEMPGQDAGIPPRDRIEDRLHRYIIAREMFPDCRHLYCRDEGAF